MDCIFCKIVAREIPSEIIFEDDEILVFKDINPQAPLHLLGIPKKHIESLNDLDAADTGSVCKILLKFKDLATEFPEFKKGYRVVSNIGREAGQTVFHLHFHMLGGRHMGWPPG